MAREFRELYDVRDIFARKSAAPNRSKDPHREGRVGKPGHPVRIADSRVETKYNIKSRANVEDVALSCACAECLELECWQKEVTRR